MLHLFLQFADEKGNDLRTPLAMKGNGRGNCPVNSENPARSQFLVQRRSLPDQCEPVAFLHQHLHFGWVRGAGKLPDLDAGIAEHLHKPHMRCRVALRLVENGKVPL